MPRPPQELERTALQDLSALKAALESEIAKLGEKLESVNASIAALTGSLTPAVGRYRNMPPQQAVQAYLRDHPNSLLKPAELAKELRRDGYVPRAKNFPGQINVCLRRLAERGLVEKASKDGVDAYRLAR